MRCYGQCCYYAVATHSQTKATPKQPPKNDGEMQVAAGPNQTVQGYGTTGRLTKWVGQSNGQSFIGDSIIFEKNGLVGIGTDTPTSKLTVQGMIETTLGGYKFPDGTVQTTAADSGLQFVNRDSTLKGNGTDASPLGIRVPLFLTATQDNINATIEAKGSDQDGPG